jgi:glycosyltransferase involved in cell wall biosynthesis
VRAARGAGAGTLVVAMFGMFAAWKKYEEVIHAVAALREQFDLQLWLLGDWTVADASYIRALRELIASRKLEDICWWSGPLPAAEISAHQQAADIFVLPQADGDLTRSGAFLAAAAHGLPCVAVRNSANQVEFVPGENVLLVAGSNAPEFQSALTTLAANAKLREQLGLEARKLYESVFAIAHAPGALPFLRSAPRTGMESTVSPLPEKAGSTSPR